MFRNLETTRGFCETQTASWRKATPQGGDAEAGQGTAALEGLTAAAGGHPVGAGSSLALPLTPNQ